jgi:hypothetical protein
MVMTKERVRGKKEEIQIFAKDLQHLPPLTLKVHPDSQGQISANVAKRKVNMKIFVGQNIIENSSKRRKKIPARAT